ncbi:MAG: uroporphyrinogen decarboxylase family protein [Acidobacteriota bacterium]
MGEILYRRGGSFAPDFSQLACVLEGGVPSRPTLFEYGVNDRLAGRLSGIPEADPSDRLSQFIRQIRAFTHAGYDYTTLSAWRTNTLSFPKGGAEKKASISQNAAPVITDRKSFEAYAWPDADAGDYDIYHDLKRELPDGMKLIASGNGGLLENVVDLAGFENLCFLYMLDEELATDLFEAVGSRLLRFYEIVSSIETVGALIVNDDWGFKNQLMFPPEMLRRWVFPWHKKMVEAIHASGKYAILHSCGRLHDVMEDVIDDLGYDAKHSFEDQIIPVEEFAGTWGARIAIMGGIDVDFLARSTPAEIRRRAIGLLEYQREHGGYALGSGNSIPDYIPDENFLAMVSSVDSL